jgi:ABC-type nitrate/sulfonate/bicarbonate transport system substrate-binding protein
MTEIRSHPAPSPVRLTVFSGAFNWPIWAAQDCGIFARNGLAVSVSEIPGSVAQWTSLAEGSADVVITLMDNVIAYREGQGEAPVTVPDAIAVMASDAAVMPALMTAPDVRSYGDLRGQTLSVDAATTGLALILYALLEKGGLKPDDYRIERTGGVLRRFEGLVKHEFAGALFNTPFSSQLEELGYHELDTAASVLQRYQGHVVATRRGWAEQNMEVLSGFLRSLSDAIDWLYDSANRAQAFAIFRKYTSGADDAAASLAYAVLFAPTTGFARKGVIDTDGVAKVVELRSKFGRPPKRLAEPSRYYDLSYLEAALGNSR